MIFADKINIKKEDILDVYRINTKNKSDPRPIIIKFTNLEKKTEALKLRNLVLNHNSTETKIYIAPDRTIKQQQKHRQLIKELKEKAKIEEGWILRNDKLIKRSQPFRQTAQILWA